MARTSLLAASLHQASEPCRDRMWSRGPKLLFLAHPFPPLRAAACVRTWNIAKYLARLDWNVTVVTPHPSVWRYVDDPQKTEANLKQERIRRILTDHRWSWLAPESLRCWNQGPGWFFGGISRNVARRLGIDNSVGWIGPAGHACSTLTAKDVDIILASGPPFTAFILARRLSDKLGRPYVLDYRDTWTVDPHSDRPARQTTVQEEARLLASCAAATVVSRSWGLILDRDFSLGSKLQIIPNGYDLEELAGIKAQHFSHFAIVYAGNFYPPKRVISPVMKAVRRLKETMNGKGTEWYFHYYGEHQNHVREEAERFGVMERVVLHGNVPRTEALSALRGAGVSVVITSVFEEAPLEDRGIIPGKVFEALGLKTPILLVAPPDGDIETVIETTGLARSFSGNDIDGMASFLKDAIFGGTVEPRDPDAYAWMNIIKKLELVLHEAIGRKSYN